jgi:chaperonin GroES
MIRPIRDNIIVKPIDAEDFMNGVFVPKAFRKKLESASKGEVVAVGSGKDGQRMPVKVGNIAVFPKHGGQDLEIDGEKYKVIKLHEVIALK